MCDGLLRFDLSDHRQSDYRGDDVNYLERDCTFTHEGKTFEAGGAVVTPERIIAYPLSKGILGDWHGSPIGRWRIIAQWKTPRSWMSSTMYQIEATVDGITYTGRGAGVGMIYKGKRKAS